MSTSKETDDPKENSFLHAWKEKSNVLAHRRKPNEIKSYIIQLNDALKYLKENNLPVFEEKSDYCKYPDKCLSVFEPHIFHKHFIIHLGSGSWENGWKNERYQKLL